MPYAIDKTRCSLCHACREACAFGAITLRREAFWIDPEACITCGVCQTVCPQGCIYDPYSKAYDMKKIRRNSHERLSKAVSGQAADHP